MTPVQKLDAKIDLDKLIEAIDNMPVGYDEFDDPNWFSGDQISLQMREGLEDYGREYGSNRIQIQSIPDVYTDTFRKHKAPSIYWYDSTGNLADVEAKRKMAPGTKPIDFWLEKKFDIILPELEGTYFETIFRELLPFTPCRSRLMRMLPKSTYSIHKDPVQRFHIAVETNEDVLFIFPKAEKIYHIPADGHVYFVDTQQVHTVVNCHKKKSRIHLMGTISSEIKTQ